MARSLAGCVSRSAITQGTSWAERRCYVGQGRASPRLRPNRQGAPPSLAHLKSGASPLGAPLACCSMARLDTTRLDTTGLETNGADAVAQARAMRAVVTGKRTAKPSINQVQAQLSPTQPALGVHALLIAQVKVAVRQTFRTHPGASAAVSVRCCRSSRPTRSPRTRPIAP